MIGVSRRQLLVGATTVATVGLVGVPGAAASGPVPVRIEGSDAQVALLPGPVSAVLLHVARRFSYEVQALGAGDAAGTSDGTGLDLLPGRLPAGVQGLFPPGGARRARHPR